MEINIKTSEANQKVVTILTHSLPGVPPENTIARIALGYSLSRMQKFEQDDLSKYDARGKEYKDSTLFPTQERDYYIALICQLYQIDKDNPLLPKYVKRHIDDGLERINNLLTNNPQYTIMDFLFDTLEQGIDALNNTSTILVPVQNRNLHIDKPSFDETISIKIGYKSKTNEPIMWDFNNTSLYTNQHIAVAGQSGTGKTRFALAFLQQIHQQTQGKVNFLYLDYKGISPADKTKLTSWFSETETTCIDAPVEPFPLNPLAFIDTINETNRKIGISNFVDSITSYSNMGVVQKQTLKKATTEAFKQHNMGEYPTFKEIYDLIKEEVNGKTDSLINIMDGLSDYNLFNFQNTNANDLLSHNYYLSLKQGLDDNIRFTSVFLVINYLINIFSNIGATEIKNNHCAIRYVLMIDEAHVLFNRGNKETLKTLEYMLRVMRSYGVSVVLLSQGIDDYNTPTFNFSEQCATAVLLPINVQNTKSVCNFLGLSTTDGNRAIQSLGKLTKGQAISNIKEYPRGEMFEIVQY